MAHDTSFDSAALISIFTDEVHAIGGEVKEAFAVDDCVYARGILPEVREVSRGDAMKGGVAMRADENEIRVHPFVYRLVCSNGAIFARAVETTVIPLSQFDDPRFELQSAIRQCAVPQAFEHATDLMRQSMDRDADLMLMLLPAVARMRGGPEMFTRLLREMGSRKTASRVPLTHFAVMNAFTATARDTRDPEMRWKLEELGGAIAAGLIVPPPRRPIQTARSVPHEALGAR